MKIKHSFLIQVLAFLAFKYIYTVAYQVINGGTLSKFEEYYHVFDFWGDLFVAIIVTFFMTKYMKNAIPERKI